MFQIPGLKFLVLLYKDLSRIETKSLSPISTQSSEHHMIRCKGAAEKATAMPRAATVTTQSARPSFRCRALPAGAIGASSAAMRPSRYFYPHKPFQARPQK